MMQPLKMRLFFYSN